MNGQAKLLVKYLDGSDTRFIIPVYQRNYDWKIENCKQLYDDLKKVNKEDRESHFFGSIVSVVNTKGTSDEKLIIDGQQRITTVSLLLLALVNLLKESSLTDKRGNLSEKIENKYLVDEFQPEEKKVKLKPIKDDQDAFLKLFEDADEYDQTSNVTQNYLYFYNRIKTEYEEGQGMDADELYNAICTLEIIDISLDPVKDDAQLIFESLNSTGLDLTEGDKIRNFILMGLENSIQEKYYYQYWNKIEKNTGYEVSAFARHYLTIKTGKTPAIKSVYTIFKTYVENGHIEVLTLLEDMTKYAKYYHAITCADIGPSAANAVLSRLNILDMSVSIPYFLALLDYKNNAGMSDKELIDVVKTIETFIFRRLMCGVPTNALNKIFAQLHRDCMRYITMGTGYAEILKYVLINKSSSGRLPNDNEFLSNVEEKDIYSMQAKNKMYLFDRLENQDTVEHTNVIENMQAGTYTIEHIMPQKLSNVWKQALGKDYQRIYDTWINKMANLTLTGYNSQYKNRPFVDKRDTKDGFKDSHLHINTFIANCEKWTEEELKRRNEEFKKLFLQLWPYPETDFKPEVTLNETHSLDEDYDFKGKYLISFSFLDTPYTADSWSDMYQQVVKQLLELDATIIYRLAKSTNHSGLDYHFTTKETDGYTQIADKLFLFVASSTMSKINCLKKLFEEYQFDGSELVIEIQNEK